MLAARIMKLHKVAETERPRKVKIDNINDILNMHGYDAVESTTVSVASFSRSIYDSNTTN